MIARGTALSCVVSTILLFAAAPNAKAQPAAANRPTSAPAVKEDQTTPVGALMVFMRAMQSGDVNRIRPLLSAATPDENIVAQLITNTAQANGEFRRTIIPLFGEEVADIYTGGTAEMEATVQAISQVSAKVEGDAATIDLGPGTEPMKLVKVGPSWLLKVENKDPSRLAKELEMARSDLRILTELTNDLREGKYKTPLELRDARRAKQAAAMSAPAPASQPGQRPPQP